MKLIVALGILGTLAHVALAGKCRIKPAFSHAEVPPSVAETVYITVSMPTEPDTTTTTSDSSPAYVESSVSDKTIHATSSSSSHASTSPTTSPKVAYYQITLAALNRALPGQSSDASCSTATYASECATNARAVTAINNGLTKYKITGRGEAVAVIALMAFESDRWQYNINHYPGNPGQGTRNMQMYKFNSEYAKELHPADTTKALGTGAVTDQVMNNVRALVLNDNDSFGSGFWYLVNHAPNYYNKANKLRSGYPADFRDYVVNSDGVGVGSGWTDARMYMWGIINGALPS